MYDGIHPDFKSMCTQPQRSIRPIESTVKKWDTMSNVLCVRLDNMGDILMTTPALKAIKHTHPQCKVTLLTSPSGAAIANHILEIDDVIIYSPPWMKATTSNEPYNGYDLSIIESLQERGFDKAIIFTTYTQSPLPAALLCYLSGIPRCLAYCHENPYQLISDWLRDPEPEHHIRHEVKRQLDLVGSVGCHTPDEHLSLCLQDKDKEYIKSLLIENGIDPSKCIVIHPGSTAPSRRYPPEQYAKAADLIIKEFNYKIIFTGSESEKSLIDEIIASMQQRAISFAGLLPLSALAALISYARVLVANNTGPAHISAAVGTPVVSLYALTNLQHTPWKVPAKILFHAVPCYCCFKAICPQKHHHCLLLVTPEQIVAAVKELLNQEKGSTTNSCKLPIIEFKEEIAF